jgi:predicted DNA-binding transcriptional regulator AlpA
VVRRAIGNAINALSCARDIEILLAFRAYQSAGTQVNRMGNAQQKTDDSSKFSSDRLLDVNEVAQLLSVATSWIYQQLRTRSSDRLPGIRLGKYSRSRDSDAFRVPAPAAHESNRGTRDVSKNAEALALQAKQQRLASLETDALDWIARAEEANLTLGRLFRESKDLLERGAWKSYFSAKFAPHCVSLGAAHAYIKKARERDAPSQSAHLDLFAAATDSRARSISNAAQSARAAVAAIEKKRTSSNQTKKRNTFRGKS